MIQIEKLTKTFYRNNEEFSPVREITMLVKKGGFVSIVGRSGSGKTTLFNMIAGLIKPTSGTVYVNGRDITTLSENELALYRNQEVGYILQGHNMLNNFTVLDNICMPAYLSDSRELFRERAEKLLCDMGMDKFANEYPKNLSGGEAKRVSIARAMINFPSVILADEPTSNLDVENSCKVMEMLRDISKNGTTVLLSTHEMEYLGYTDYTLKMEAGCLIS